MYYSRDQNGRRVRSYQATGQKEREAAVKLSLCCAVCLTHSSLTTSDASPAPAASMMDCCVWQKLKSSLKNEYQVFLQSV